MKTINRTVGEVLREVGSAAVRIGHFLMRTLSRLSWPALLASCIFLALLLTILPLALTLFAVFLLLKLAAAMLAGYHDKKRNGRYTPHKES